MFSANGTLAGLMEVVITETNGEKNFSLCTPFMSEIADPDVNAPSTLHIGNEQAFLELAKFLKEVADKIQVK
jgi:hypothetical protein